MDHNGDGNYNVFDGDYPQLLGDRMLWWARTDQTVHEETTTISPEGNATTNFKLSNSNPWPAGKYKVEISLNGASAKTVDFEIK